MSLLGDTEENPDVHLKTDFSCSSCHFCGLVSFGLRSVDQKNPRLFPKGRARQNSYIFLGFFTVLNSSLPYGISGITLKS